MVTGEVDDTVGTVDAPLLVETIDGSLLYRRYMTGQPFPSERAAQLVAMVPGGDE